jgi:hypothetical protein
MIYTFRILCKKAKKMNPSGNYSAQLSSTPYYCFGSSCGGQNVDLSWQCQDQNCGTVSVSGQLPRPTIVPGNGKPLVYVTLPSISQVAGYQTGSGSISPPNQPGCGSGGLTLVSNQKNQMTFDMTNTPLSFCDKSVLDATLITDNSRIQCHKIPFTNFSWCDNPHRPREGFFIYDRN